MPTVNLQRVLHTINVGASKVGVLLPNTYGGIETDTGVDKASATNKPELVFTSSNLLKAGQALRVRVRWIEGTKIRTANLICDVEKAATVCGELVGKPFRSGTIKSAFFPRRARLG